MMSEEMKNQQIEQKQIEEMAKVIMGAVSVTIQYVQAPANETEARIEAKALIAAGYRKQSEVVKEFVAGVTVELNKRRDSELYDKDSILGIINKVAAEYGVEVEK